MTEKKKNLLKNLFASKGGCNCGVTIVPEPAQNDTVKSAQLQNNQKTESKE